MARADEPAFPTIETEDWTHGEQPAGAPPIPTPVTMQYGLTIREWYAGQALQGMIAGRFSPPFIEGVLVHEAVAQAAFLYADAMLAESEKK